MQKQPAGSGWAVTSLAYDGAGNVASLTTPDGVTTRYQYDAALRLIAETKPFGNGNFAWTQYSYDAASNLTRSELR
jgi:YD repeat-containing protein